MVQNAEISRAQSTSNAEASLEEKPAEASIAATMIPATAVTLCLLTSALTLSAHAADSSPVSEPTLALTAHDTDSATPATLLEPVPVAARASVPQARAGSVGVGATVDNFLGFYVHFAGSYALTEYLDAMLIGTIFTATQFGTNSVSVQDEEGNVTPASNNAIGLFVPVGPALRFRLIKDKLHITPFLEFANGGLLSGQRNDPDATHHTGSFAEGLVPGLSVETKLGRVAAGLKGAYFFPIRNLGPYRLQLVRVSAFANYSLRDWMDVGLMVDWLQVAKKTDVPNFEPYDDFLFFGPQFDLHFTKNAGISFAAGADFARPPEGVENEGRSFYRAGVHMKF